MLLDTCASVENLARGCGTAGLVQGVECPCGRFSREAPRSQLQGIKPLRLWSNDTTCLVKNNCSSGSIIFSSALLAYVSCDKGGQTMRCNMRYRDNLNNDVILKLTSQRMSKDAFYLLCCLTELFNIGFVRRSPLLITLRCLMTHLKFNYAKQLSSDLMRCCIVWPRP